MMMVLPNSLLRRLSRVRTSCADCGVEVAGGLVAEQQIGVGDDGAGDGDALLLAAGELAGEVVEAVAEADELERGGGVFDALALLEVGELQRQFDVFEGGQHRDQVERLEDEADVVVAPAGDGAVGELAAGPRRGRGSRRWWAGPWRR